MKRHEPIIQKLYGCDIEKAQHDMWSAIMSSKLLNGESTKTVPLPFEEKAVMGAQHNRQDTAIAWKVERDYAKSKGISLNKQTRESVEFKQGQ